MASNGLCQADVWVSAQQVGGSGVGFDEFLSCFCPGPDLNLVRGGGDGRPVAFWMRRRGAQVSALGNQGAVLSSADNGSNPGTMAVETRGKPVKDRGLGHGL